MPDRPRFAHRASVALPLAGILLAALIALGWISIRLWTREQQAQEQLRLSLATAQSQAGEAQATATAAHTTSTTNQQENGRLQTTAEAALNQLTTLTAENTTLQATADAANTHAAEQSHIAQANQIAVQALTLAEENLPAAMLLSIEASRMADTAAIRNSLLYSLQRNPVLKSIWYGDYSPTDLAFSPDGRYLAAVYIHGQVVLYDTTTGRPIGEPLLGLNQNTAGETNTGVHVAFSESGRLVAAVKRGGGEGNHMVVWDTTTREVVAATDQYSPHHVAFWGEDQLITAHENALILWSIQNGLFVEVARYEEGVYLFEPNPAGQTIAFTNEMSRLSFWNPTSGEVTHYDIRIGAPIYSLAFNPEGTILAIGSTVVILWDVAAGERLAELVPSQGAYGQAVEFSADGQLLMTASQLIQLWDMTYLSPVGQPLQPWGYTQEFMDATLSPDGKMIVSSYLNGDLLFWEPTAETRLKQWTLPPTGGLQNLGFVADEYMLATYDRRSDELVFWDAITGNLVTPQPLTQPDVEGFAFDRDYGIAAAYVFTNGVGTIQLVDLQARQIIKEFPGSNGRFMAFALHPEGTILAARTEETKVALWDATTGEMIGAPLTGHNKYIEGMAFSSSGQQLATVSDSEIFLWDMATRQPLFSIPTTSGLTGVTFSPDGRFLATFSTYGNPISLWDTTTGELIGRVPSGGINEITFAEAYPLLAIGTLNYIDFGRRLFSVSLWDHATSQQLGMPFDRHLDPALSTDGRLLATLYYADPGLSYELVITDISLESWQEQLCHVVNRNFTESEWSYYFGREPYRPTCPNLP